MAYFQTRPASHPSVSIANRFDRKRGGNIMTDRGWVYGQTASAAAEGRARTERSSICFYQHLNWALFWHTVTTITEKWWLRKTKSFCVRSVLGAESRQKADSSCWKQSALFLGNEAGRGWNIDLWVSLPASSAFLWNVPEFVYTRWWGISSLQWNDVMSFLGSNTET